MNHIKKYDYLYIVSILSVLIFGSIYGFLVLNPFYNYWLLKGGDLTQHYIGWEFFRQSNWQFPLGLMDRIAYPNNISIIFTDSIPLFALLFKMFSPILPQTFQYFGLWELICFILQGVFSSKILMLITKDKVNSVIGAMFFVIAPIFIARVFFHTALSSQWLILLALYLSIKYLTSENKENRSLVVSWALLGTLCGSIHLYYIPMCFIIMAAFLLVKVIREKSFIQSFIIACSYTLCSIFTVYILGGFSHDHQLDAGGLGQFSFNLNGFFNSMGWSIFFPELTAYGEGSGDGFAYLGFGIYGLMIISTLLFVLKYKKHNLKLNSGVIFKLMPYVIMIPLFVLISCSHIMAVNKNIFIRLPYPDKVVSLWGIFRASGRFIWPVVYIIILFLISYVVKTINKKAITSLTLGILFLLQVIDIGNVLINKNNEFGANYVESSIIQDINWDNIMKGKKHVVFVSDVRQNQEILYGISQYAYENNMSINDFYFAHSASSGDIDKSLEEYMNNINNRTVYIFKMSDLDLIDKYSLHYYLLDGIIVGTMDQISALETLEGSMQ